MLTLMADSADARRHAADAAATPMIDAARRRRRR